jgi:hypothetical protein
VGPAAKHDHGGSHQLAGGLHFTFDWWPACRIGMRAGFQMRLQAIAAVQAKVLRLNSVAVADVSPGKVCSSGFLGVREGLRVLDAVGFAGWPPCAAGIIKKSELPL